MWQQLRCRIPAAQFSVFADYCFNTCSISSNSNQQHERFGDLPSLKTSFQRRFCFFHREKIILLNEYESHFTILYYHERHLLNNSAEPPK